jgi:transmembrane sensor
MQKIPIEDLLDLYISKQINREQQKELCDRLNQARDEDQENASVWLSREWDETSMETPGSDSMKALIKLRSVLSVKDDDQHFHHLSATFSPDSGTVIKKFLRYAAVFLLAFGLAWLIFRPEKTVIKKQSAGINVVNVPNGSKGILTLEDGTRIWLNCGSSLSYVDFSDAGSREVFLEGEAFFDVTRDKSKPFVVNTSDLKLKVLGTRFNVKSYPSEKITETVLVSGKVQIEEINAPTAVKKPIMLEPNQKATYYSMTGKFELDEQSPKSKDDLNIPLKQKVIETVNPELYTSWKDEKLIFSNERLESLVIKMERWYNVNITLNDTLLNNYRYTGKFEKENIEQALQALKLATPLEYHIDKNNVTLYLSDKNNKH